MNAIELTDGYKLDHRRQYPEGTEFVYSNWTPRSCEYFPEAKEGAVVFGIQYFIKKYLIDYFNKEFFNKDEDEAVNHFARRIKTFLGPDNRVGVEHIRELHRLGYLPVRIKALPEGSICPIRVPMLTIINTDPRFFWITNFLETLMSCELWLPMTSATTARLYKKELMRHAKKTGFDKDNLSFLCHDFSMRGMAGLEASITSGLGHLTSFCGSETIPAINAAEEYYNADAEKESLAGTVPASEHSVMCAGGNDSELETFKRFITELYPTGFCSIVSDTWDFWRVITEYLPQLKDIIMNRNGRLVIRPDSGDPVEIITGVREENIVDINGVKYYVKNANGFDVQYTEAVYSAILASPKEYEKYKLDECQLKGAYEILWEIFGGHVNDKGFKILDTHIGMIYGDSITLERQKEIYKRLEDKGFAATNLVLGIGSYTYQYKTRDSLGFAMKATWCQIKGEPKEIFKSPKTDSGMKKSLKGLIYIDRENGKYVAHDQVSKQLEKNGYLETVFENGKLTSECSLNSIRINIDESLLLP